MVSWRYYYNDAIGVYTVEKVKIMAVQDVVLYPDDPLTKKAAPLTRMGPSVQALAADLFETMETYDGCGLAAPQIGIAKRIVAVYEREEDLRLCLVNPEIYGVDGEQIAEEGCLSIPYVFAPVPRSMSIGVRAFNELGEPLDFEASGLLARIIQHEVDHLEGIIFLDRLDVLTHEAKMREWAETREQILAELGSGIPHVG